MNVLRHAVVKLMKPWQGSFLPESKLYLCRDALDQVVERTLALVGFLKAQGATATHNMDNLLLRESMDVIGAQALPMSRRRLHVKCAEEQYLGGNHWHPIPCSCHSLPHQQRVELIL